MVIRSEIAMKFSVTFRTERCKGCGLCIEFCSKKILGFDESVLNASGVHPVIIKEPDACVGCCNCAMMCPDGIITIEKNDEKEVQP